MNWDNVSDDEQIRTLSDKDNGRSNAPPKKRPKTPWTLTLQNLVAMA